MISIYDFSLFPYALGDVMSWNVKQCVRAMNSKETEIDLYIHNGEPTNIHQEKYVSSYNRNSFMMDLLPAFYTNPILSNVKIFHNSKDLCDALPEKVAESHFQFMDKNMHDINKVFYKELCSHHEINDYFHANKYIPNLIAPHGFDPKMLNEFNGKKLIAVNIRARMKDQSLGPIDPHRDSNVYVWQSFLEIVHDTKKDFVFILLGKQAEQHSEILEVSNVIFPRHIGWTLAQELALIPKCTGFMGTCSGFAGMAVFGKKPYLITKCTPASYDFYGIPFGHDRVPFATDQQRLTHGEETVESLMYYLERIINATN